MATKKGKEKEVKTDYRAKYLRALADYQNYQRRMEEEMNRVSFRAKKELILKFLPFLDGLEKAESFVKDEGLKMVKKEFEKVLKAEGLEEIEILGKEFTPHLAEAVAVAQGDKDGRVVKVLRKGYLWQGEVIRPAQVEVSRK